MTESRAPRPTDLVALVTFDDEVRENLAVTRDRLAEPSSSPRPLSAAIEQWLHLGRKTWVSVGGRQIRGIATARELSSKRAWEIDTLIDAEGAFEGSPVLADLLRQSAVAAGESEVTHVLLRTPHESEAASAAMRTGFRPVVVERLWSGHLEAAKSEHGVRESRDTDAFATFQLYSRAFPVDARSALAMTFEEWEAVRDQRWADRGSRLVVERDGRIEGTAQYARATGQFALIAETDAAATNLLAALGRRLAETEAQVALVPTCAGHAERALLAAGFTPGAEFALLCKRTVRPVRDEAYARTGIVITG